MIFVISPEYPPHPGGIATWSEGLTEGLTQLGHPVRAFVKQRRSGPGAEPIYGRSWRRMAGLWTRLQVPVAQADALVFACWRMATLAAPAARARGVPVVVAVHGSDVSRLSRAPTALARLHELGVQFVAVSEFLKARMAAMGLPARVLPMPIRLNPAPSPSSERAGLIAVARLGPLKGVDRCVRLCAAMGQTLTVVGDGPQRLALTLLAEELGTSVRWEGTLSRKETRQRMGQSRACLLLSRPDVDGAGQEGLGLVLLEAQAEGTPAVGVSVGGVPEAVGPGLLLQSPDDSRRSAELLSDWLLADARSAQAHAWVSKNHSPRRAAEATLACLS